MFILVEFFLVDQVKIILFFVFFFFRKSLLT